MSDIATKLTYLNETKSQLKDMINYGLPTENQITNETTFRNYVKGIFEAFIESLRDSTTLYTNLPKISGNGTQITLNDTANAPMRITLKASELTQASTPTPDSPQDIHTISGDNSVVVCGKNIANISIIGKVPSLSNGQLVTLDQGACTEFIEIDNTNDYVISYGNNATFVILFYDENYNYLNFNAYGVPNNYKLSNASVYSNAKYIRLRVEYYSNVDWVQLEKGSTATTYEPYVSQTSPINLPVENLFDKDNEQKVVINPATGIERYGLRFKAPNKKVSVSGNWRSGLSLTYRLITNNVASNYVSILANTTISVIDEIVIYCGDDNVKMSSIVPNLQIEISDKPNSYTPYGTTPIEYCKIGNYEDEFILTSGKNKLDLTDLTYIKSINTTGTWSNNAYTINGITYTFNEGGTIKVNGTSTGNAGLYLYGTSINQKNIDCKYILLGSTINNIIFRVMNYTNGYHTLGTNNSATTPTELDLSTYKTGYIEIMIYSGQTISNVLLTPMLTETSITNFEPYGTNQWYLKKNIGKVVLDGSESWVRNSTYTNAYYVDNYFTDILQNANRTMLSDYFTYGGKMSSSAVVQVGQFYTWSTILDRIILGFDAPDLATFKTWLASNNVSIYYVLNTPTYTQITGTLETQLNNIYEKLLSYKGTTNISQVNNDLPFVLGVSAIQDLI